MKKMAIFLLIASLVLAAAAILVARRHPRRATPPPAAPAQSAAPVIPAPALQPMDTLQSSVKLDTRTDTRPDADAKRRLLERLQQEEKRQQPQEGRN